MKILHIITNTDLGGAQAVVRDLCTGALEKGYTVAVASMQGGPFWQTLDSRVIKFTVKSLIKPISLIPDLKAFFELKKIIKGFKPDILQLHSSKAGTLGRLAGFSYRKKIVYTVHGFDSVRIRNRKFLFIEKILQKWTGAIIPVSKYDEKNLLAEGIKHNVVCIKNAISEPEKDLNQTEIINKIEKEKKAKKFIVLSIARISAQKRFEQFIEVAEKLVNEDFSFFWVGTPTDAEYENIFSKIKIPENTIFLGAVNNAGNLIHYCDVFLLCTNYEGLPITILESLACGKPIIATPVGGIPEVVDKNTGITANSTDEVILALQKLAKDENLRKILGENAKKKFLEEYTLNHMFEEYDKVYISLNKTKK